MRPSKKKKKKKRMQQSMRSTDLLRRVMFPPDSACTSCANCDRVVLTNNPHVVGTYMIVRKSAVVSVSPWMNMAISVRRRTADLSGRDGCGRIRPGGIVRSLEQRLYVVVHIHRSLTC